MVNAEAGTPGASSTERQQAEVDLAILAVIGSANCPIGAPKTVRPPESIPGSLNPVTGLRATVDTIRRGVDAGLDYRARYGDVYKLSFAGTPCVGVWDPDIFHRILRNDDRAWSTAMGWDKLMFEGLDERGNVGGLLALDFEDHRIARKVVAPAFTTKAIDAYLLTAQRHFSETSGHPGTDAGDVGAPVNGVTGTLGGAAFTMQSGIAHNDAASGTIDIIFSSKPHPGRLIRAPCMRFGRTRHYARTPSVARGAFSVRERRADLVHRADGLSVMGLETNDYGRSDSKSHYEGACERRSVPKFKRCGAHDMWLVWP